MNIEIVTIGTELLLGLTIDTNGAEIARALAPVGVRIVRRTAVADRAEEIREAVAAALHQTGAVITTGGLGPTRDDITKKIVADLFDCPARVRRVDLGVPARAVCPGGTNSGAEQSESGRSAEGRNGPAEPVGDGPRTVARRGTRARDSAAGRPL